MGRAVMKRKGAILLETLLYILSVSLLAAAVFPFSGRAVRHLSLLQIHSRMTEQSLFAADFMTEKLRNNLERCDRGYAGNTFRYWAYNERKKKSEYRFLVQEDKLKVRLYTGMSQPVTGESLSGAEEIIFSGGEGNPLFRQTEKGLIRMAFAMKRSRTEEKRTTETAVLPYRDFYHAKPGAVYKNEKA